MSLATTPGLTVVLPSDRLATIDGTMAALRRQSAAERVEVLIVLPAAETPPPAGAADRLHGVRVLECSGIEQRNWLARARAAGIRAARAPVVAIGETHSFPEPEWAAALLAAHREPWTAVGAAMLNANPATTISWANLFVDFGPWVERRERGPMDSLPGHNTSYKRDVLLARGDRLELDFASETLLFAALAAAGHGLLFEPAAATRHLNLAGAYWFVERFDHDREWAVLRSRDWRLARRALYLLGAPLIPFVRFARIAPELRRTGRGRDPALIATVLLGLAAGALGEAAGYARRDAGGSSRRLHRVEIHRQRFSKRRGGEPS